MERRGFSILVPDEDDDVLRVSIENQHVRLSLIERTERRERTLTAEERTKQRRYPWSVERFEYSRSGRLTLRLDEYLERGMRRSWSDGKKQNLEECLAGVLQGIEDAADELRRQEEERRRRDEELREAQRIWEEEERGKRLEEERRSELLSQVDDWHRAERVRQFVRRVELVGGHPDEALSTWVAWAEAIADDIDPLSGSAALVLRRSE